MSNGDGTSVGDGGTGVYSRIELRLDRIDDKLDTRMVALDTKLDTRMTTLDSKVDAQSSRLDRLEGRMDGSLGMLKWLGPTGVAAIVYGIFKASGLI